MNKVFRNISLPFKKSKAVLISFIFTLIGLSSTLISYTKIWILNNKVITYKQDGIIDSSEEPLFIYMEIPVRSDGKKNCWQEDDGSWGSQYDIYIYNNTDFPFLDWTLQMTVPPEARIDSSWNGEYKEFPGVIRVKGSEPALTVTAMPHNCLKVGFVLYTDELMEESNFSLKGRFVRNPFKNHFFHTSIVFFVFSLLVFIVSLVVFYLVQKQANIDNEKLDSLIKLCARFIDVRDEYTKMHSSHVGYYAKKIAEELGYDEEFQKNIYYMGMMHDVGKVLIPLEILCKTSKLNDEEWAEMKKHTIYGANILDGFTAVPGIKEAALYHHERYDGKGYPSGLKGEEIPIQSRIIGVADSYDAMHTNRSYRVHLPDDVILQELEKNKGTQFDPRAAEAMINILKNKKLDENL